MAAIEAAVFDWDGTLVDSKRALVASFQETTTELLWVPFPGALETIERLRAAGQKIGVATSKARIRLDLEAQRTGIGPLLDVSVSGDEVAVAKPDPESVIEAITGARDIDEA